MRTPDQVLRDLRSLINAAHENGTRVIDSENPFVEAVGITDEAKAAGPVRPIIGDAERDALLAVVDKASRNIGDMSRVLGAIMDVIGKFGPLVGI